jgi:hypothetical protein
VRPRHDLERIFGVNRAVDFYESLFEQLAFPRTAPREDTIAPEA